MPHDPSDFRSDTVTRPTPEMRRAMAEAIVGDDVFGEDPTVAALEAEAARLFGREAALFVPTGCQGNQIAIRLHTSPGEEVVVEAASHTYDWELAGMAALSGVQARAIESVRGALDPERVRATLRSAGGFRPRCGLLVVENTHNFHGGDGRQRRSIDQPAMTAREPARVGQMLEHGLERDAVAALDVEGAGNLALAGLAAARLNEFEEFSLAGQL